jgi:hypothetical protein
VFATWKEFSQHGKRCSQHSQHASQHHDLTANMFPDSNCVAGNVSDAIARIGRQGASSSVNFISFCWYLWSGLPDVSTQLFQQIGCLARIKQYQCNFICLTDMSCSIFRQLNSIFTHNGTEGFYFLGVCARKRHRRYHAPPRNGSSGGAGGARAPLLLDIQRSPPNHLL